MGKIGMTLEEFRVKYMPDVSDDELIHIFMSNKNKEVSDLRGSVERLRKLSESLRLDNCKKEAQLTKAKEALEKMRVGTNLTQFSEHTRLDNIRNTITEILNQLKENE